MKYRYIVLALLIHLSLFGQERTLKTYEGFFDFHYDTSEDRIYLDVEHLDNEFLYVNALAAGMGSNDIGLDRGKLGRTAVVKFIKAGQKLLLIQPNLRYRAISDNKEEQKSVSEAFAQSVLGGFPIQSEEKGIYRIDITDFLIQDAHGVAAELKRKKQGAYKLNKQMSALYLERTRAFPKNVEFESILTFVGEPTGQHVRSVTPNPGHVTVRQHFSFIELPDDGYEMRVFDPRSGAIGMSYLDYATPITSPIKKRFVIRHRLAKKDPAAPVSEPVEPIIYYLDPGAPEPVRSALLEGGRWWNEAFEAAGYKDAFQFKMLPEGADPLDVRYNVVQWVHRSTRGWSYGMSVVDPRTGEIIKGHVSLGSLRIRQDYMIGQGLMGVEDVPDSENRPLQMALARIRQLSAHEIGHTLGFTHNFAASVNDRASVMDYPHPYITIKDGEIDASTAYDTGIGEWDKVTVAYSYQDFPNDVVEKNALDELMKKAQADGLKFISDSDARAQGGAHIYAHLWDNGTNPVKELERVLNVRERAIGQFALDNLEEGYPLTVLEDRFVPIYFFHRYQLEAAVKVIGGLDYSYAVKGDGQNVVRPVDSDMEQRALEVLLESIGVRSLKIPERLLKLFPPRAYSYDRTRESFKSTTGISFDALSAAATATSFATDLLLHPERLNRLVQHNALYPNRLSVNLLLDKLIGESFGKQHDLSYDSELQHVINNTILQTLFEVGASDKSGFQVKAEINSVLNDLRQDLLTGMSGAYARHFVEQIDSYRENPGKFKRIDPPKIPDGSPIGSIRCDFE
jgi:hypothetical protein